MNSFRQKKKQFRKSLSIPLTLKKSNINDPAFGEYINVFCNDQSLVTCKSKKDTADQLTKTHYKFFSYLFRKCLSYSMNVSFQDLEIVKCGKRKRCYVDFYLEYKSLITNRVKGVIIEIDTSKHSSNIHTQKHDKALEQLFKTKGMYLLRISSKFINTTRKKVWHHIVKRFLKEIKPQEPFSLFAPCEFYTRVEGTVVKYRGVKLIKLDY